MTKELAIQLIENLPAEFDMEILIERLIFVDKIDNGLKDVNEGKVYSHEEVKQIIKTF